MPWERKKHPIFAAWKVARTSQLQFFQGDTSGIWIAARYW